MIIQHSYKQHITTTALNSGRIKAMTSYNKKTITINRDNSLQKQENHDKAVIILLEHLEWDIKSKSIFSTEKPSYDGWIYILMGE